MKSDCATGSVYAPPRDSFPDRGTLVSIPYGRSAICNLPEHERAIELAVRYIESNFRRRLTVSEMAKVAMYSRWHFTRIFRELTAMSPCEFLTATRMAEAKHLLSETDCTVAEICRSVGYRSLSTFTSLFKELVGLPPGQFRQAMRSQRCTSASGQPNAFPPGLRTWAPGDGRGSQSLFDGEAVT